jgi:hypothetical protein
VWTAASVRAAAALAPTAPVPDQNRGEQCALFGLPNLPVYIALSVTDASSRIDMTCYLQLIPLLSCTSSSIINYRC